MQRLEAPFHVLQRILQLPQRARETFETARLSRQKSACFHDFCQAYFVPDDVASVLHARANALACANQNLPPSKTHGDYPGFIISEAVKQGKLDGEALEELSQTNRMLRIGQMAYPGEGDIFSSLSSMLIVKSSKRQAELLPIAWPQERVERFGEWLQEIGWSLQDRYASSSEQS